MKTIYSNGANIPALGFGTYKLEAMSCYEMVKEALKIGYRHIDTAQIYDNEREVGLAIKDSGINRDEIFLTTKVWVTRFRNGDLQKSVEASLEKLQVDHVNLLLLHWPNPEVPLETTIPALNEVHQRGLTKHIGVSNFNSKRFNKSVELSKVPIATNQVEFHALLVQDVLRAECKKHGASLTAYSPLAKGEILENAVIKEIAKNKNCSAAQVALRWLYQNENIVLIPKTANPQRAKDNFETLNIELDEEEMKKISALQSPDGRVVFNDKLEPNWD